MNTRHLNYNKTKPNMEQKEATLDADGGLSHVSAITRNTVEKLVTEAFENCDIDNSGKLSKEQFETWVKMNPSVLNSLETVFVKHVWSGFDEEENVDTDADAKEQFLSHSSMHSLHRLESPRYSSKIGL